MKKGLILAIFGLLALSAAAEDIGGKSAVGFEQGVGTGGGALGKGISYRINFSNTVGIMGVLGFSYSQKAEEITDEKKGEILYQEDKDRIDYTIGAYGVVVFKRFKRAHLNAMTGLLYTIRDNHFEDVTATDGSNGSGTRDEGTPFSISAEKLKTTEIHFRLLLAPELFIFPNFSLEYKFGLDVSLQDHPTLLTTETINKEKVLGKRQRLHIDIIGDLNLLNSASIRFYF